MWFDRKTTIILYRTFINFNKFIAFKYLATIQTYLSSKVLPLNSYQYNIILIDNKEIIN